MQVKSIAESAILSTFIKLPFVIKIFVLSIFEWPVTYVLLYIFVSALISLSHGAIGRSMVLIVVLLDHTNLFKSNRESLGTIGETNQASGVRKA